MKKILLTLVLLIGIVVGLFAQKLTYQAVIRDNNQQLVVNTAVKAAVTITFTTGVPYAEEVNGSTNIHGLLSFEFGDETLAGRDWTGASIAVKVVNAATPSTVYVNDEARPVSAVPYALNVNGQSIQNYLTAHNYVTQTQVDATIHDSIADIAAKSHTHGNKDLLDTYNQTNADLADAVAKKHAHDNAAVLAATTAPYTDADSIKLKGIAEGAEVNVQADWNQSTTTADDYIKNKPTIPTVPTNVSAFSNDAGYLTNADLTTLLSAINHKIDSLAHLVDSLSNLIPGGDTVKFTCGTSKVKDVDNNEYNTVKIGSQCWMAQNLRTSTNTASTGHIYTPTTTDYDVETYGRLYDWDAVMQGGLSSTAAPSGVQGICPDGWHVPSDAEWTALTDYVNIEVNGYSCDGYQTIANALSSPTGWQNSRECAAGHSSATLNKTGFSAVPAGYCVGGNFDDFGYHAYFWSATQDGDDEAWFRGLYSYDSYVSGNREGKELGFSVRCLRDAGVGGGTTPSAPATMSCEQVMECMGDTLGQLNAKIEAQGNTIDSLAHLVDSLSNLPHGGGGTPTVADGQPCPGTATVSDVDGNTYNTVKIGNQCWMKENLRTTTKRNNVGNVYTENTTAGYNAETYGYYYDWEAVMQNESGDKVQGICPTGWHVPTWAEYLQLTDYVNSQPIFCCYGESGKISKALASSEGWASVDRPDSECCIGNAPARNNWTRFSLMPAGHYLSEYRESGMEATIWSATDFGSMVHVLWLDAASDEIGETFCLREMGCSVRCLRDASIGGGDNPSEPATMSCEQVMECMGDTLGKLNAKIEAQGTEIQNLEGTVTTQGETITAQGARLDSLAHIVDSLSNLTPVNPDTPTGPFTCGTDSIKDVDNNWYHTVKIGEQCWTKENMRCTTSPSTGTSILEYPASSYSYTGKKAYYVNGDANNTATYGLLYNWNAAVDTFNTSYGETSTNTSYSNAPSVTFSGNRRGICPQGWHVPSDAEWTQLTTYVKSQSEYVCPGCSGTDDEWTTFCIAKALASTTGWKTNSSTCAVGNTPSNNNATGFSAVPAGNYYGNYNDFGGNAYFWSATQGDSDNAYYRRLRYYSANVYSRSDGKFYGFSVRCVRD